MILVEFIYNFSQTLNLGCLRGAHVITSKNKMNIRWCHILVTIKIQCKNVLLWSLHVFFLVHPKVFLPQGIYS
jgi:hypothetical protein